MTIYMKAEQNVEIERDEVLLKDIGRFYCSDEGVLDKIKLLKLYQFDNSKGRGQRHNRRGEHRVVVSCLKIIEEIEKCYPNVNVVSIGEPQILIERIKPQNRHGILDTVKLIFVSLISFFGTSFTIMAFHNDIGITNLFQKIYEMVMGRQGDGYSVLELSYSIGLAVGIILFFNHIGGRRITIDPTSIEVEMREYERSVNTALIETSDREGTTVDVK